MCTINWFVSSRSGNLEACRGYKGDFCSHCPARTACKWKLKMEIERNKLLEVLRNVHDTWRWVQEGCSHSSPTPRTVYQLVLTNFKTVCLSVLSCALLPNSCLLLMFYLFFTVSPPHTQTHFVWHQIANSCEFFLWFHFFTLTSLIRIYHRSILSVVGFVVVAAAEHMFLCPADAAVCCLNEWGIYLNAI